ncbi:MAG: GNAT family N-acetyltransferase [Anaerolineales bacterium]
MSIGRIETSQNNGLSMQTFEETIFNNWANRFQCSPSVLQQGGTTWIPEQKYANQNRIILWHIGKHTFVLFDPSLDELLNDIKAKFSLNTALSGEDIQKRLTSNTIASHDIGFVHYLFPADLPILTPPNTFNVRMLSPADAEQLAELHRNCTPEEVDEGYVEIDHEAVFGCFQDNQLVSAASGYRMTGFMDIGVLTHTNFRRLGLGKLVVGELCKWTISHNIIAQYRFDSTNTNSLGVAKALNFRHYFTSESLIIN